MSADPGVLLEVISQAARERRDLAGALREAQVVGAASVAAALDRGQSLDAALATVLDPAIARLLSGPCPDLGRVAQLARDEWRRRQRQRASLYQHLAYPVLTALVVLAGASVFLALWPHPTAWAWLGLGGPPLALLALAFALPQLGQAGERLPVAGAWLRHDRLTRQFARAALVARWQLTEAEAQRLLGFDCTALGAVLARPDASDHCQHLAEHHAQRAEYLLGLLGRLATVLVFACTGAVILTLAMSELRQYLHWCLG